MKAVTYKLKYPVEWDGEEVKEIEIRRPKGRHIKKLGGETALKDVMGIAHHITDYTDGFFDDLDGADYLGISEEIMGFLESGR